ncbi:protein NRT1/ PTR FAMILY 8.3-like [Tasmannia lanceolata]|uniref:protein NRT1/ PTR FAMILY 8.3-like n=1 Tax=Tasmannia lanceolata TaxID=3420 RepID=UPI004063C891
MKLSSMEEAVEQGETNQLLNKDGLEKQYTEDGSLDIHGKPASRHKTGNWRASSILLGVECLESLAFFGIAANLVIYLSKVFHEGNASVAASIGTWVGTGFLTPFLGALIADAYWGRYRTISVFALIYLLGMVILTLSASLPSLKPPSCEGNSCRSATEAQKVVFFFGLYLIAFGSGGVKSSLLPLGADQFEDGNPIERERKESFFNWFYFSINLGALISSTVIVWIQENVDWALGFGIATFFIALAVVVFFSGTSIYRLQRPSGSPLNRILQVLVASLRKTSLKVPVDSCNLFEARDKNSTILGSRRLEHTDEFRFLDKAATISDFDAQNGNSASPWILCTITQVEELKILLRLLPIWLSSIVYSIAYAQMSTTFIEQGAAMNTKIRTFSVPPASLFAFEVLSVMFWILIYDTVLITIGKKFVGEGRGLSQLQRMGIGHFLMILAMSVAALVEMKRLGSFMSGNTISIAWQLPQYFIFGASEVFNYVSQLEFFYGQGPDTMRSMCTASSLLTISLGNYLSSFLVMLVMHLSSRGGRSGWIPDDLNEGHLDYFFWAMAGLSTLNFVIYLACTKRYRLKKVIVED